MKICGKIIKYQATPDFLPPSSFALDTHVYLINIWAYMRTREKKPVQGGRGGKQPTSIGSLLVSTVLSRGGNTVLVHILRDLMLYHLGGNRGLKAE